MKNHIWVLEELHNEDVQKKWRPLNMFNSRKAAREYVGAYYGSDYPVRVVKFVRSV
jgi:hypothetical protein